jgi:NAD(P)-dependent dehydrogenase (short-subunit alcohol dehydrogenase family)
MVTEKKSLNSSVIIFGGSQGIGRLLAVYLSGKNYGVSVMARGRWYLMRFKKEMEQKKIKINIIAGDVSNEKKVQRAFENHEKFFGQNPLVVINTAAVQGPLGPLWTLDSKKWQQTLNINLLGSFYVVKWAIKTMMPQRAGSIILFSGGGAAYGRPNFSAYAASKTAVLRMVETVADELKNAGFKKIIVNAVAPGAVKTRMTEEILKAGKKAGAAALQQARAVRRSLNSAAPEIFRLVDFLCQPKLNRGISGRLIHIREDYLGFVRKYFPQPAESGKLRRRPLTKG